MHKVERIEWPMLVRILAGIDRASLTQARDAFAVELVASLFMLGFVLAIAMWIQVGLGLAPLAELGAEVAEIARGQRNRLDAGGPAEIQPLVNEINGLLDEREKEIALARNRAADLAHGLKTPLTALAADARLLREKGESDIAQSLERVSDAMQRHVAREIARARVKRVRRGGKPPETPVREVVDALVRTLARTGIEARFEIHIDATLMVALDRIDLMEVIGNLLENASRYAVSLVRVSVIEEHSLALSCYRRRRPRASRRRRVVGPSAWWSARRNRRRGSWPGNRSRRARCLWDDDEVFAFGPRRIARFN